MKRMFSRLLSMIICIGILCSLAVPSAYAASTVINYNVSYSPATCNASAGSLPAGITTVYIGETVYFNLQVDSGQKLKSVALYLQPVGSASYSKYKTETATNYLRYAYFSYVIGNSAGTMKYYFKLTYTDGSTKNTAGTTITVKQNSTSSKIASFIADSRWKDGVSWGASQQPKLSTYSSSGCCAYAADFAKYVYGKNSPRGGTKYTSASDIKTGDIIYVTPMHWMCIISRSGNTIKVAEGNYDSKVHIAFYTLNGNTILRSSGSTYKTFSYGYHF